MSSSSSIRSSSKNLLATAKLTARAAAPQRLYRNKSTGLSGWRNHLRTAKVAVVKDYNGTDLMGNA